MQKIIESYNLEEEFLYNKTYLFIKGYATGKKLQNTLKALPLARQLHNGQYRKGSVLIDNKSYQLPYILHCLKVCSTLISLSLPLNHEEEDILLSASLLHDTLEDALDKLPREGKEFTEDYGFPKEVYEIVKLLSKNTGATQEELDHYFNQIKENKLALLIKLSDRSHNVETLYTMKVEKIHKYTNETRVWIYPLCAYGKAHYPELSNGITILKSKILSLTEATEVVMEKQEHIIQKQEKKIKELEQIISTKK